MLRNISVIWCGTAAPFTVRRHALRIVARRTSSRLTPLGWATPGFGGQLPGFGGQPPGLGGQLSGTGGQLSGGQPGFTARAAYSGNPAPQRSRGTP
ncbi:hypothetical protein GCM10009767_14810 [Kocuria aegyptia]|uniref:Uncharacterized protein n=1 Tax=Kocuria aegyptia TaxID=330943 RepID=A0ABN2KHY5_9MICC